MAMTVYIQNLQEKTLRDSTCYKCKAKIIFARYKDDYDSHFNGEKSKFAGKWVGLDPLTEDQKTQQYPQYNLHFQNCFPNGFRFAFGDEILYSAFRGPEEVYKIVGLDDVGKYYGIRALNDKQVQSKPSWHPISLVDKKATPLNEAGKLLFT